MADIFKYMADIYISIQGKYLHLNAWQISTDKHMADIYI